jgi:regulator of replication initiation timing
MVGERKIMARAVPKKRGRPAKKKTAKKAVASAVPVTVDTTARRGRPVSVDVLQRKLVRTQDGLSKERTRRQEMKVKCDKLVAANRAYRAELKELRSRLSVIEAERSTAEKEALRQEKMEIARNEAIGRFLAKWEKEYLAKQDKGSGRKRRRGRPKGS